MPDAPTPQEIEALLARSDMAMSEALDVLTCLTDSIQKHGNYSPESTITFIGQASSACTEAKNTAATALRALAEERDRLAARSYTLAVAIMGGEDAPGYADSVDAETLVEQLREDRRRDGSEIDRLAYERSAIGVTERERIARMLEHEAEMLPCAEDAAVTRANAMLVRGDGSYDEAEAIESRIGAAERERDRLVAENAQLMEALERISVGIDSFWTEDGALQHQMSIEGAKRIARAAIANARRQKESRDA